MLNQRSHQIWLAVSALALVMGLLGIWRWQRTYAALVVPKPVLTEELPLRAVARVPIKSASPGAETAFLASISAQSVYAMDVDSAAVLLATSENQSIYPASTTKLMTALVVLEHYNLDKIVVADDAVGVEGSVLGIQVGDAFSVRDLLSALLINSSNDAAMMLAEAHPLGMQGFVKAMNEQARSLKLDATTFVNPTGLDAIGQQTTTHDLAVLARAVAQFPLLSEIVRQPSKVIFDASGQKTFTLETTNDLLRRDLGFVGIKTGTTELAKEMLISQYKNSDHQVVIVVAGSDDRYQDTLLIKDWIENHYSWEDRTSVTLE